MKQLVRKPFFLALLLSIPLWVVFNNYIVAIIVALLVAFLLSMCHSLFLLSKGKPGKQAHTTDQDESQAPQPPLEKRSLTLPDQDS
ncbi:MAG TPA: hypothetical protein VL002_14495 [Candidimonas sp.]|nr:hypothetical protein [Candidimonas sp.]